MKCLKYGLATMLLASWSLISIATDCNSTDLVGHNCYPGLTVEALPNTVDLKTVKDMDIDPISGNLFIGQATGSGTGNILEINPNTGATVSTIPFPSNGLAFAEDGTLYFGLSKALLATWRRDTNVFRIFASIPGVTDVQLGKDGQLFVAVSGPSGITSPNSVLRVDRKDGFFENVLTHAQSEAALGVGLSTLSYFAIASDGTMLTTFHNGEQVRLIPGCSVTDLSPCLSPFNNRQLEVAALNDAAMAVTPDDLFFHYDNSGKIFAEWPDGRVKLIVAGHIDRNLNAFRGFGSAETAMVSDGKSLYFANDKGKMFRLRATGEQNLKSFLEASPGTGNLRVTVQDPNTLEPIAGAKIILNGVTKVTSGADGSYLFSNLDAGLYEVRIEISPYAPIYEVLTLDVGEEQDFTPELSGGLPTFLAAGLSADLFATSSNDNTIGNVDVFLDKEGHLYAINNGDTARGGNITKVTIHPETREYLSSQVVAQGGNLNNAWFVSVDNDLNIYSSTGNTGLLKLPPASEQPITLTVDPNDNTIVRDQNGANRLLSRLRDSDGAVFLSNGDSVFGSGTSGNSSEAIPCFPNGTRNTLMRRAAPIGDSPCENNGSGGKESTYSIGTPTGGGDSLITNPDILKLDSQDRIYVANREIPGTAYSNVVRIIPDCTLNTLCSAELIWPGQGTGKPLDENGNPITSGVFTTSLADQNGVVFIRGNDFYSNPSVRIVSPDGQALLPVAGGLLSDYGGMILEPNGRTLYVANKENILRIRSLDERTIAENLIEPPPDALAFGSMAIFKSYSNSGKPVEPEPYDDSRIDWSLLQQKASQPVQPSSSGGGAIIWLSIFLIFVLANKKRQFKLF